MIDKDVRGKHCLEGGWDEVEGELLRRWGIRGGGRREGGRGSDRGGGGGGWKVECEPKAHRSTPHHSLLA